MHLPPRPAMNRYIPVLPEVCHIWRIPGNRGEKKENTDLIIYIEKLLSSDWLR